MDSAFGRRWGLSDGLDQCVAHFEPFCSRLLISSHMHNSLIKLLLDHLVVSETFLAHSELGPDIRAALSALRLQLVVLLFQKVKLLLETLVLKLSLLDEEHVILVQMLDPGSLISLRADLQLERAKF